jgi:hypothetical protein
VHAFRPQIHTRVVTLYCCQLKCDLRADTSVYALYGLSAAPPKKSFAARVAAILGIGAAHQHEISGPQGRRKRKYKPHADNVRSIVYLPTVHLH